MSKKMKGIAVEDAKAKLKHHTLLQDYQDLQKEVFHMRNRLEAAKGSKKRLLAEVRFLRRRYTYLVETKSLKQRQEQSRELGLQNKFSKEGKKPHKKEAHQFKLPPLPDLKHKWRVYAGKEGSLRNATNVAGLKHNNFASSSMKEEASLNRNYRKRRLSGGDNASAVQSNEPAIYSSQNKTGISNGLRGRIAVFDLNQDTSLVRKEAKLAKQAPTFDLNEISMDEEVDYEDLKVEESRKVPLVLQMMNNPVSDINLSVM